MLCFAPAIGEGVVEVSCQGTHAEVQFPSLVPGICTSLVPRIGTLHSILNII